MEITTLSVSIDDLPAVLALVREGRVGLEDQRGGALWLRSEALAEPLDATVAELIVEADGFVGIALLDDVPLGVLIARHGAQSLHRVATVHELFVVSEARGVGLGESLMSACIHWAAERGCEGIDGYALPGDRATKNFFETFGLVARGIVVHRKLVSDSGSDQ